MSANLQASPIPKGMGRKLRRARNVVKKWEAANRANHPTRGTMTPEENQIWDEGVIARRYERAAALILADKLRKS